ncbi:HD domain-containing protein [Candidatus Woesearchaeota archaeon]|nr:HD domain-containing protein [Candidatus Woesearchaeota archaeon]
MDITTRIREDVEQRFDSARGSHDWEHTERVYNLCVSIGEKEGADMDLLKIAALLHDIGREEQDKAKGKVCHAERGAEIASEILKQHGLDDEKVDRITHCIQCHRFRNSNIPQSTEAKVLFDADKLDAIGAVGIGRAFLFSGEVGARLHNPDVDIEKTEEYTREDTAYREYMVKLRKIKDRMLTEEGRRVAEDRHQFMVDFFNRINDEVKGKS